MLKGNVVGYVMIVAVLAIAVAGSVSFAAKSPRAKADDTVYYPIESISYVIGSKRAIGYFTRGHEKCELTLMIAEAVDLDAANPLSAARVRLALRPGEGAGVDSEEGQSIDLTCGPDAETLVVRLSETDREQSRSQ